MVTVNEPIPAEVRRTARAELYDDTFARLTAVEARRPHAVEFWRRIGYQIVGVVPDAEGPGKPSITLARRL
jgi:aminoglycoside 6'-N-acetyltransferase I